MFTIVNFICSIFDNSVKLFVLKDVLFNKVKVKEVAGRYITNQHISGFIPALDSRFSVEVLGKSVQSEPIKSITFGKGPIRILMWSQMHGNESTTTKAVIDLLNFFQTSKTESAKYFESFTIKIIPILNPDGAKAYTRVNANQIDLNRDAQNLTQPESIILKECFEEFQPNYCYNLHDQRTIYNVGRTKKPASISFLAPAFDEKRNLSDSRAVSMQLIAGMNKKLQEFIPGMVGRYDDSFNSNCVGDTFQMTNTPTILFEAGHFPGDYSREETRKYIFIALLESLDIIISKRLRRFSVKDYKTIPENGKLFYDVLIKNAGILDKSLENLDSIGVLYKEVLNNGSISFEPEVADKFYESNEYFGHKVVNCLEQEDLEWLSNKGITEIVK